MLKQFAATTGIALAILGAGAGAASAAEADNAKDLPNTVDVCNAPTVDNPDKKDTWIGIVNKDSLPLIAPLPLLKPETHLIVGLCQEEENKGDQDQEQEAPGNSDEAPGQDKGEDGPGNSENAPGHDQDGPGNSENAPGQNKGGDAPFPSQPL